jgi:hypothetical protein
MAAPHVAGGAALLKERHPTWTVAQIKSALTTTGDAVRVAAGGKEVTSTREGGGRIDLVRADNPLIFVSPTGLTFGLAPPGQTTTRTIDVTDAGGGPDPWTVSVAAQSMPSGAALTVTPTVVPGTPVTVTLTTTAAAAEGEATGFVILTRGVDVRRVPFWFRVSSPKLAHEPRTLLPGPGIFHGNTRGKPALVSTYRYPETSFVSVSVPLDLSGPEQVFRFVANGKLANFGAVVTSHAPGVRVSPRLVVADDENRLVGAAALPANLNPYQNYSQSVLAVGAILPLPGAYDFVFDTPTRGKPGKFTFRVWANDTKPPTVRLLSRTIARGGRIRFAVADGGSGVDPASVGVKIDGLQHAGHYANGIVTVNETLTAGSHTVSLTVSDYQETKNMEDVGPILPNTRTLRTTVVVG